jgi:hypothetical protein
MYRVHDQPASGPKQLAGEVRAQVSEEAVVGAVTREVDIGADEDMPVDASFKHLESRCLIQRESTFYWAALMVSAMMAIARATKLSLRVNCIAKEVQVD